MKGEVIFPERSERIQVSSFWQPATATQRARWSSSATQLQASAGANTEPWVGGAPSARPASGASPAAAPASATATQTCATPTLENAESAGTMLQDTSVNGRKGFPVVCTRFSFLDLHRGLVGSQLCGRLLRESSAWLGGPLSALSLPREPQLRSLQRTLLPSRADLGPDHL